MFFHKLYEELGPVPNELTSELTEWCRKVNPDHALARTESVFNAYDSRLIVVMDKFKPGYVPAYVRAKPLIDWLVQNMGHLNYPVVPYRFELSFVRPNSRVTEHYDQFLFHRLADRIHVPLVSWGGSEFTGRWHQDTEQTRYSIRAGHYTRLNNRVPHQAINDSGRVRVHAILDFMPESLDREREYRVLDKYVPDAHEFYYKP